MQETTGDKKWRILFMSQALSAEDGTCCHLSLAGWHVLQISDPLEALTAAKSGAIDLALLHYPVSEAVDMDLPNVLRDVAPADYLPVMIIASDSAEQHRCRCLDSGADEVISGGTSPAECISRIRALLRIKDLHDQLADSRRALQRSVQRERDLLAKLRRDNAHLQVLCTTDPLTHVQNVRSFKDILAHEFHMAARYNTQLSLLMMDVDYFKVINDTHGHPSGDYVLKELAVILKQCVRQSDVVSRTGGDEFSVILPKASRQEAMAFADRIRREVFKRRFIVYGEEIHATISLGVATFPADAEIVDAEMLVYFADQALLLAKEQGRDRLVNIEEMSTATRVRLRRQYRHSTEADDGAYIPAELT